MSLGKVFLLINRVISPEYLRDWKDYQNEHSVLWNWACLSFRIILGLKSAYWI